jgi:hypothetical protein
MRFPGYLLNPGDLFQVKPQSVMYAMGAPKVPFAAMPVDDDLDADVRRRPAPAEEVEEEVEDTRTPKQILKDLHSQSKTILTSSKDDLGAKRKQTLRAFSKDVRKLMSKAGRGEVDTHDIEAQFAEIQEQIRLAKDSQETGISQPPSAQSPTADSSQAQQPTTITTPESSEDTSRSDAAQIRRALEYLSLNEVDESKPYATPWTPRDYLSAFAFIPRYLEVNQNICAAVYLRHPVAKPGYSEVPTPFSEEASSAAFKWYLRRK